MGKNWKLVSIGLDICFAAIFCYYAIKFAVAEKWAIPYALVGLLWSLIVISDVKELAVNFKKGDYHEVETNMDYCI